MSPTGRSKRERHVSRCPCDSAARLRMTASRLAPPALRSELGHPVVQRLLSWCRGCSPGAKAVLLAQRLFACRSGGCSLCAIASLRQRACPAARGRPIVAGCAGSAMDQMGSLLQRPGSDQASDPDPIGRRDRGGTMRLVWGHPAGQALRPVQGWRPASPPAVAGGVASGSSDSTWGAVASAG